MSSYGSAGSVRSRAGAGGAVGVSGFTQLVRALTRIEGSLPMEVRARLRVAGQIIATAAKANVPHATGEHESWPSIEDGMKVSVAQSAAAIYTQAIHGGVQNVGGWSRGRGPHVSRASASHYMDRAVKDTAAETLAAMEQLLEWLLVTFQE